MSRKPRILTFALWILCLGISPIVCFGGEPIPGVGPTSPVQKIQGDFKFLEGPAWGPDQNLYFTDIPANRIYRLLAGDKVELFLEPSGHTNGLMFTPAGVLLMCQMDGQLAKVSLEDKKVEVVADKHNGTRFNACNDLVIDSEGGIYFTDPRYQSPDPYPQGTEAFYYRSAAGEVTRLGADLIAPNGIALSPDEKTLYVVPSMQKTMMAYEVQSPGKIGPGRVLCELKQPGDEGNSGGDGMAVDVKGNLYITSALGVQVFDPQGKLLGIIEVPEVPANVTFGGADNKTLFITARTGLYRAPMDVAGHVFGKLK